jgi:murein DD-endopeptidase MepM/ murein hydrolase activator NlpD
LRPGENLYRLSRYYGVSVDAIIRANAIEEVTSLPVGKVLWIPGAKRGASRQPLAGSGGTRAPAPSDGKEPQLAWPVQGRLGSKFGWRNGRRHEGIDIPAKRGAPIYAAEAGRVIHSGGGMGDYGTVVVLKHAGRYKTVYAHNRRNRVKKGEFVEKGDLIGEVGSTGNATGPHVHFELRRDSTALDPLLYLP